MQRRGSRVAWNDDSWKDGYDAWKLASPDEYDDDVCDHDDYDVDILEGRARCNRCSESWHVTEEEVARQIEHQRQYSEWEERENRREFWRRLTHPIRWPIHRFWWRRAGVSAERPASLLVMVGVGIGIYAAFGPYWLGVAIGVCILFVMVMLVTQTRGGGER